MLPGLILGCASSGGYEFALIGDVPYAPSDSARFGRLIDALNAEASLEWVMHTGDIKSGDSACTDALLQSRLDWLQTIIHPVILTPGDNEWTDCYRNESEGYAPLERLEMLRTMFFSEPGQTLGGTTMQVESQADEGYPENTRWNRRGVYFATMHLVGSRNALLTFPDRTPMDDNEVRIRTEAAVTWLSETFEKAQNERSRGMFLMIHANPHFEAREANPFESFLSALERVVVRFDGPVWLAHGDTHYFRLDKPLRHSTTGRRIERFTRLESFGSPDVHWIRVRVDPETRHVFSIIPEVIDANRYEHP